MITVLLATDDEALAAELTVLGAEAGTFLVDRVLPDTASLDVVLDGLQSAGEVDVVVIDGRVGPLPPLEVARSLAVSHPDTTLVMLEEAPTQDLLDRALLAGFRGIVSRPLALQDVSAKIEAAGLWAQRLRRRRHVGPQDRRCRLLVLAGSKGGVGTSTIATYLALETQLANPDRRVCLVDFDLQAGDVRTFLDLTHHRSVDDLVEVAGEVTTQHLGEALYAHPSGLRVLLPPPQGEHEGAVTPEVARGILAAIRARFDLVIADVGSVVTDGGAMATELADEVLVVCTPDVLSLRAATRLIGLWRRRGHRTDGISVLVNRASRVSEVKPDFVARVLDLPVLEAAIPAAFRDLEMVVNTGVPERVGGGAFRDGILELCRELQLVRPRPRARLLFGNRDDSGALGLELAGLLPWLLVGLVLVWQLVVVGWSHAMAQHAVGTGARLLAVSRPTASQVEAVTRAALPPVLQDDVEVEVVGRDTVRLTVGVPVLLPRLGSLWAVTLEQHGAPERAP